MPVLADNALAPLLGAFYSAHGPTPKDAEQAEIATQKSFRQGGTQIEPGLGLLDITVEPQLLNDNRWGRFFSLAYTHPERLAIGLTRDTALEIGPQGREVIGENVVFPARPAPGRAGRRGERRVCDRQRPAGCLRAGRSGAAPARRRGCQPDARRHPGGPRADAGPHSHAIPRASDFHPRAQ